MGWPESWWGFSIHKIMEKPQGPFWTNPVNVSVLCVCVCVHMHSSGALAQLFIRYAHWRKSFEHCGVKIGGWGCFQLS